MVNNFSQIELLNAFKVACNLLYFLLLEVCEKQINQTVNEMPTQLIIEASIHRFKTILINIH